MVLVFAIVQPAAEQGWGAPLTLVCFAAAIVLVIAFLLRETLASAPLIPLRIFRERGVASANVIQLCSAAAMFGLSVLVVLDLQRVQGADPLRAGLSFLPLTAVMGALSVRYAQPLAERLGLRATLIVGLGLVAAGMLLFTRLPVHAEYVKDVLPSMLLIGAGFGMVVPAVMGLAMSAATPADAGAASGLINTTTQVGGALGLAVLTTLAAAHTRHLELAGRGHAAALTSGYRLAFVVSFSLCLVALAVVALVPAADRAPAPVPEAA
jgi:MFS family permease